LFFHREDRSNGKILESGQWLKSKPVVIPVTIHDTDYYYNIYMNLRVTNDYKNIVIFGPKVEVTNPKGEKSQ